MRFAASDLGLHCLLRPVCPNTLSKYGNSIKSNPFRNHPGSAPYSKKKKKMLGRLVKFIIKAYAISSL